MLSRDPKGVGELVEEQCLLWEHRKPAEIRAQAAVPVVAISRPEGTFALEIAEKLGDKRHMSVYGSNLIHEVAKVSHYADRVVATLDEHGRTYLDDILASLDREGGLVSDQYFFSLSRVIGSIGRHGNAIILGRGAGYILPHHNVLRVRITAPEEFRIDQVRREHDLTASEAREHIQSIDGDRGAFLWRYLGVRHEDPAFFDLTINNARFNADDSVGLIETALDRLRSRH